MLAVDEPIVFISSGNERESCLKFDRSMNPFGNWTLRVIPIVIIRVVQMVESAKLFSEAPRNTMTVAHARHLPLKLFFQDLRKLPTFRIRVFWESLPF